MATDPKAESAELARRQCRPLEGDSKPMTESAVREMLGKIEGWEHGEGEIAKLFTFKNFYHTMAFVNAVAWVAHTQDHHPDMEVGYKTCRVRYRTHVVEGLTENDFICAAKVDELVNRDDTAR